MRNFIILLLYLFFFDIIISQSNLRLSYISRPLKNIFNKEKNNSNFFLNINNNYYNYSFHSDYVSNNGHPNIDNAAELYVTGKSARLTSARFEYASSWISFAFEPYTIFNNNNYLKTELPPEFEGNNNFNSKSNQSRTDMGLRQSGIIIHYKGFGLGYGNMSHWWGPGFHSALALSSNAPSQETYSFGTYKDITIGNFSFGSQLIVMPYKNTYNSQLYFSGLKAHLAYNSPSSIITVGMHRTYLSGNFNSNSNINDKWTVFDAARLVLEPLFGQKKKDLDYIDTGTPGFDAWDQVLTGYIKIFIPKINFEVYADLASDDNRGNFTDLKAHWDHTLGYQLGFKKITDLNNKNLFIGVEYLTTRSPNTFKQSFYRSNDPNAPNYYTKSQYDYFTYQNRRMGAHSGPSSDDLIYMLGLDTDKYMAFVSYNQERHGIKSMNYPELKTEYIFTYIKKINTNNILSLTMEYEKINNYGFQSNNISYSKLIWFGYSFHIR